MDGRDFGPPRSVHGPPPLLSGLAMESHRLGATGRLAPAAGPMAAGLPAALQPGKFLASGISLHSHPGKAPRIPRRGRQLHRSPVPPFRGQHRRVLRTPALVEPPPPAPPKYLVFTCRLAAFSRVFLTSFLLRWASMGEKRVGESGWGKWGENIGVWKNPFRMEKKGEWWIKK